MAIENGMKEMCQDMQHPEYYLTLAAIWARALVYKYSVHAKDLKLIHLPSQPLHNVRPKVMEMIQDLES